MTTNPLSRRALIAAAPAALVAGAPALAGTNTVPDAALRELVRVHAEGQACLAALSDRFTEAYDRYLAELPEPPEALFPCRYWAFFPDPQGSHHGRRYYRPEQADAIRDELSGRCVASDPRMRERVEARRAEILEACAAYGAVEEAVGASTGVWEAQAAYDAQASRMEALRRQLIEARPETIEGALLKIQAASLGFDDLADLEENWLAGEAATAETLAISALRDVMRIAGYLKA